MGTTDKKVATPDELIAASKDPAVRDITVVGALTAAPSFRLLPGQSLRGENEQASIAFREGGDGLRLSSDNRIEQIRIHTAPEKRAIFNDTGVSTLGRISLRGVTTHGRVQILARDKVRGGHIDVHGLDIVTADARGAVERPQGYGVHVLQGAFTLWNMQEDKNVSITADLTGVSAGRAGAPVRGSGIFVSGGGDEGGRLLVKRLETEAVYSDGGIVPGTPDQITGGVFTVYGVHADLVRNRGPVVTYGTNDMVLDNWGVVDRWLAEDEDHLAWSERHRVRELRDGARTQGQRANRDIRQGLPRFQCLYGYG